MVVFTLVYFIHVFKKFNTSFVFHQLQFYSADKKGRDMNIPRIFEFLYAVYVQGVKQIY